MKLLREVGYLIYGGGGGLDYLSAHNFNWSWLCGTLKISNLISPSLDLEIYYLFYKEPVQGFILKILQPPPPPGD